MLVTLPHFSSTGKKEKERGKERRKEGKKARGKELLINLEKKACLI